MVTKTNKSQKTDKPFIEKNPVTDEIKALVPQEYRAQSGIHWSKQDQRFYVYRRLGYKYIPERKRGIDLREPLGTIKDNVFKYSPSFLKKQEINRLQNKVDTLVAEKNSAALGVSAEQIRSIREVVRDEQDPRQTAKTAFPLSYVLAVMLLSSMAGLSSAVSIANYWKRFHSELSELFEGFPEENISHDTVNRILRIIHRTEFENMLKRVAANTLEVAQNRIIHIDGQAVRASKTDEASKGRYFFNAYDSSNEQVIGHLLIGAKDNEIVREIEFVSSLDLNPQDMLTADAMNTQTEFVHYLADKKIHYCLAVKENHPKLYKEILNLFATTEQTQIKTIQQTDCGHGRIEVRVSRVINARLLSKQFLSQWKGLENGSIIETITQTETKSGKEKTTYDKRYFISSYPYAGDGVEKYLHSVVRRHWTVENNLHWVLDNTFGQDRIQCTNENYLSNRVSLNKIALNILKRASMLILEKTHHNYSIQTMKELCSTPASAIETVSTVTSLSNLILNVK